MPISPRRPRLTQKTTIAVVAVIAIATVLIVAAIFRRDIFLRGHTIECGDGRRYSIDSREFATQYSGYSLELEASLEDKGKISAKLDPVQLQQISQALQSGNEFRKGIVAGYNACAITKIQYSDYLSRFQTLDSLARQINLLLSNTSLSETERTQLASLLQQYSQVAGNWATK